MTTRWSRFLFFAAFMVASVFMGVVKCQMNASVKSRAQDFPTFLSGVKHAYLIVEDSFLQHVLTYPSGADAIAVQGVLDYLKALGFAEVNWGLGSQVPNHYPSSCDVAKVRIYWEAQGTTLVNFGMAFFSCKNDIFEFTSNKSLYINGYTDVRSSVVRIYLGMYGFKKTQNAMNRLSLPIEMTSWSGESIRAHLQQNNGDRIEGIYELIPESSAESRYLVGVVGSASGYSVVYLGGAKNHLDWKAGEVKAVISKTGTPGLFKAVWRMANKTKNDNCYVAFGEGVMNVDLVGSQTSVYLKIFPEFEETADVELRSPILGTGFGITSDGLVVTNSHVVHEAQKIHVRGINGDFSKEWEARIVVEDVVNDLAILRIIDSSFVTLGIIPFVVNAGGVDVGARVFTLGYPMRSVLGDEIKLTDGIVSSKTGFKGDVTAYQITVPLQPGNSGGPLFSSSGAVVGIVNAKFQDGENVSYAIKANYLRNLFDLLSEAPVFPVAKSMAGLSLTEQSKILRDFVYTIEVY